MAEDKRADIARDFCLQLTKKKAPFAIRVDRESKNHWAA